jgi:hypothetical protein
MRSIKDKFEYTKGVISNVNRKMTDNTVAKRQRTMMYKTLHRNQRRTLFMKLNSVRVYHN